MRTAPETDLLELLTQGPDRVEVADTTSGAAVELPEELRTVVRWLAEQQQAGRSVTVRATGSPSSLIGTQEAADLLGVSRPTVVKWLDTGVLPCQRFGSHRHVRRADVLAHLAAQESPALS